MRGIFRDSMGAFADCAVLFPLLVLLGAKGYFSPVILLGSAGLAYILSGYYFRIPMPVQPLKSITIGALAIGASPLEVRWSAAVLGAVCFVFVGLRKETLLERIPKRVIHEVQVGLGALLLWQAWRGISGSTPETAAAAAGLSLVILALPAWHGIPWMGTLAALGMAFGVWKIWHAPLAAADAILTPELRFSLVASLVLPQLALTFTNSVAGTQAAAREYFPGRCGRVSVRGLCSSIGIGNILMAAAGGLPFCHGSGGLTAHVKGGAATQMSNYVIGGFLLMLAAVSAWRGSFFPVVPALLVFSLLSVTGIQHLRLARETAGSLSGKACLAAAFALALLTQNLLYVLCFGFLMEAARKIFPPRVQRLATEEE